MPAKPEFRRCRLCNTDQRLKVDATFVVHTSAGGSSESCLGSGRSVSKIESILRTFESVDNNENFERRLEVIDNGDSVIFEAVAEANETVATVHVWVDPKDVFRMIDELNAIARMHGWTRDIQPC